MAGRGWRAARQQAWPREIGHCCEWAEWAGAGVIAAVSRLIAEVSEIQELDLNPVMVCSGGARVLDARIAVEREGGARA